VPPLDLEPGLVPAQGAFKDHLPPNLRAFLADAASVHLVVHRQPRSLTTASWRVTQRVLKFIRALQPDVFHVDGADQALRLGIGIPWRLKVPLVLSVHDPQPHSGESDWHISLTRKLLFRRARRFVLYNSAALGPFCRQNKIPPSRARAVLMGAVQLHGETPNEADRDAGPVVLFFGRISPYKGLDVLYAAAPLVARQVPGVRFVIAGRPIAGYELPPAPALPRGGTLEIMADYIPNETARTLFESARVVACPYLDATQSAVILTSYGYGKPVVATRVGGLPEYVHDEESGLLVDAGDSGALAAGLVRILQDEHLRQHLRSGIKALARGPLAWSNTADELVDLYRGVIDPTTP
jgi:glycosyltransferase involved in cell wall biosynthesis